MLKKTLHKYLRQSILLIALLFLLILMYVRLWGDATVMVTPLAICVVFQLLACGFYGIVWKRVATVSPQSLPTLYLAASGLRMTAGIGVVIIFLLLKDNMVAVRFFVISFLLFYIVLLIYDTVFFVKVERALKSER